MATKASARTGKKPGKSPAARSRKPAKPGKAQARKADALPARARQATSATPKPSKASSSAAAKPAAKRSAQRARPGAGKAGPRADKGDGALPLQAYIATLPAWQRGIAQRVDELVARAVPKASRAVKWGAAFYGVPGQGWFLSVKGFSKHVKLMFFRGASLKPVPPAGEHEQGRALDVRQGDNLDEAVVADWIRQAAALPGWGNA